MSVSLLFSQEALKDSFTFDVLVTDSQKEAEYV